MKAGSLVILPAKFSLQKFIDKNRVSVEKFISQLQKENELKNPTIEFSNNSSHSNFMADEIRIQQIVSNLVKNAIKFSENKGNNSHILVDFSWDDKKNTLCIKVQDNGIGINPDKHDIIFEPFRQVDEKITRNY
ncbi:TPA: hypothetical protein DEP21_02890 [Patescibacteria group bacterium]|nr:hypothetical protein [Candidatus Gracilibacteria bacterium]